MGKIKKIFTNIRIIIVLIFILSALIAINPNPFAKGVTIRSVELNSSAFIAGMTSPDPNDAPTSKERIVSINNKAVENIEDYYSLTSDLKVNRTVLVKTNEGLYKLTTKEAYEEVVLSEQELKEIIEEEYDPVTNSTKNATKKILVNKTIKIPSGVEDLGLSVYNSPSTNIKKGLDLQGGTRVLLQPEEVLDSAEMETLIENMKYRLNIYGLSDIVVREAGDLSGNQYVVVEIAGAKESEVRDLLAQQGKFEAKIGNITVFKGADIPYVCKSADCSGIDPQKGCGKTGDIWICMFRFAISLDPAAAEKMASRTEKLEVVEGHLSESLKLYLDDVQVDELQISSELKGKPATQISITGSGQGSTQQEAVYNTLENSMNRLQTVLITGRLPAKLEIVKTDNISPLFGEEYVKNALMIGTLAILAVGLVAVFRYRRLKIAIPMILTSIFEVVLLIGFAAFARKFMTVDLAAIAGMIIVVGTGVDHLIVITDETLRGESEIHDWKKRIKNAFFIIMAAYFTTAVAMLPLLFAGAGLLKGFALTTLIGVSIGVFIARPAYAAIIEILLKE